MTDSSQVHLDGLVEAVANFYAATDQVDARAASEAAANLCSGSGYVYAPTELVEAFTRAIEVGYAAALSAVRDGEFDEDIRGWRPQLFET
ncbi:hypothetical protein GCM10010211_17740 [Streptomyces albospinus]|uniref:Uncharacterized protein n=1 Tax=Streptomyces albospinus TaxID=285515 RepID=A0ABQ2UTU6_9ACTN|nr:hypothetical protein [Streptomyces albospinus]GGU53460.1 hypothetical protein GCM10010211_17740 [Streptomyces albospinus]